MGNDSGSDMEDDDDDEEVQINDPVIKQAAIELKAKTTKGNKSTENVGKKKEKETAVVSKADDNLQTNAQRKKAFKNMQKDKRKQSKKLLSSEENKMVDSDEDDAYDFNQAF